MNNPRLLSFMSRLGVSICVFGAVLCLGAVSVSTLNNVLARQALSASDEPVRTQLNRTDIFTPVEQRIRDRENMIARLRNPVAIREEQRQLAPLYEEFGKKNLDLGQFARAEQAYQRATNLDPDSAKYSGDLAQLYALAAVRQSEARQRLMLLRNSSDYFQAAATTEENPDRKRQYQDGAATALYSTATELRQSGLNSEALRELQKARQIVRAGSPLANQIDSMLSQLGR